MVYGINHDDGHRRIFPFLLLGSPDHPKGYKGSIYLYILYTVL